LQIANMSGIVSGVWLLIIIVLEIVTRKKNEK